MTSLKIKSLSVKYGRHEAVRDFEENVRPGEWLCLIGPNGAGKSSVLRAIVGLAPHAGSEVTLGAEARSARCLCSSSATPARFDDSARVCTSWA
jgi:ABC-type branched-subunit amino acid transport system ATPase component